MDVLKGLVKPRPTPQQLSGSAASATSASSSTAASERCNGRRRRWRKRSGRLQNATTWYLPRCICGLLLRDW